MKKILYLFIFICFVPLKANAVSFTADAVQIRNGDFSHARMFWTDKKVRFEYLEQGVAMAQVYDSSNKKTIWLDTENKVYLERQSNDDVDKIKVVNKSVVIKNPCTLYSKATCTRLKETKINGRNTIKWLVTFIEQGTDKHVFQWLDKQYGTVIKQENPDGSFLNTTIEENVDVNGRKTRKIDMYAISQSGMSKQNVQWYDSKLNIVVRQVFPDGSLDELRNIKVEKIDPDLFKIPKGYTEVNQLIKEQPLPDQSKVAAQPASFEFVETQTN